MARKQVNINCQHFNKGVGTCQALPKQKFFIFSYSQECILINKCNSCDLQEKYARPVQPPTPQGHVTNVFSEIAKTIDERYYFIEE